VEHRTVRVAECKMGETPIAPDPGEPVVCRGVLRIHGNGAAEVPVRCIRNSERPVSFRNCPVALSCFAQGELREGRRELRVLLLYVRR
jgi:hypothetical protein